MGKVRLLITLLVLTAGLSGCDGLRWLMGFGGSDPDANNGEPTSTQALTTANNVNTLRNEVAEIQITLPSSWQEDTRLHPSAELQASDPANQLYLVVVAEDEAALNRFGIKDNAEKYRTLLIGKLNRSDGQTATDVAFVGEDFATQYEIRGLLAAESPVVYLHTTVLTENRYYQVVAWTTPDQYQFHKTELQTITNSFRETLE